MVKSDNLAEFTPALAASNNARLPLKGWAQELAWRWNGGTYSLFVLHGNIFDVYPVQEGEEIAFVSLKTFLARRIFAERSFLLFYDIGDGLSFANASMQGRFFEWLEVFDRVENTNYRQQGPPREFIKLAPLLRRFFMHAAEDKRESITLIMDFPEKVIPNSSDAYSSLEERMALVTMLKWAASPEMRRLDVGVLLITESVSELHPDLVQNPHVAQIKIDLPTQEDRSLFIGSGTLKALAGGRPISDWCDLSPEELANRLSGFEPVTRPAPAGRGGSQWQTGYCRASVRGQEKS